MRFYKNTFVFFLAASKTASKTVGKNRSHKTKVIKNEGKTMKVKNEGKKMQVTKNEGNAAVLS